MNIHKIKLLRDHIAKLSDDEWSINSVAKCFLGNSYKLRINDHVSRRSFRQWLDIDMNLENALTMPGPYETRTDITIPVAVSVLDNLITTGKIDWDYAIANPVKLDVVK